MPSTAVLVLDQIIASLQVLRDRTARAAAITTLGMTVIAIATAPGIDPGFWTWAALLFTGALTMTAIITFVASRERGIPEADRQHRITAAVTIGVIALVFNLFFSFSSTLLLGLGMVTLARQALRIRPGVFPWLLCASLVILVPWWIWAALDAWDPGLLLLIPLAALAYLGGSHIRDAYAEAGDDRVLTARGHRIGAWLAMLAGGIVVVTAGLVGESSYPWVSLGGITMAVAVAAEAGVSRPDDQPGKYASAICDAAFVTTAVCWLVSIT